MIIRVSFSLIWGFHIRLSDLQQRRYKGSLIIKAISTALHFTNHICFLDTETRRCNVLLTFLLILEPSHFANHRPISYMLFGHSNEKSYCFIDSANVFQRLSFCQMFTTHIRVLDIQTSIAKDSKGLVTFLI